MAEYGGYNDDESPPYGDPLYQEELIGAVRRSPTLITPTQGGAPRRAPMRVTEGDFVSNRPMTGYGQMRTAVGDLSNADRPVSEQQFLAQAGVPQGAQPAPQPGSALPQAVAATQGPGVAARQASQEYGRRAMDLQTQMPDMSAMIEANRRRAAGAPTDVSTAMLLQALGGQEFSPLANTLIAQAAKARAPEDVGGWGTIQNGVFTPNAYKQREAEITRLLKFADMKETQAAHEVNEAERERAHRAAEQARIRAEQMHAENMRENRELRRDLAGGRQADRDTADRTRRTDAVRKEYNARLDKVKQGTYFAEQVVTALADPTIARNAPAQVALVMQFGKMLDPDSVVREAEQRMISSARGFADTLTQLIPRLQTGALLTPQQIQQMREVALQYQQGSATRVQDLNDFYTDLAERGRLPVADIIQGKPGRLDTPPEGAVKPRGAPTQPSTRRRDDPAPDDPPVGAVRPRSR